MPASPGSNSSISVHQTSRPTPGCASSPTRPSPAKWKEALTSPRDHPSDMQQTQRALHHLRRFTATPEACYFCVWEGYGDLNPPPSVLHGSRVTIPHRRYFLLKGSNPPTTRVRCRP